MLKGRSGLVMAIGSRAASDVSDRHTAAGCPAVAGCSQDATSLHAAAHGQHSLSCSQIDVEGAVPLAAMSTSKIDYSVPSLASAPVFGALPFQLSPAAEKAAYSACSSTTHVEPSTCYHSAAKSAKDHSDGASRRVLGNGAKTQTVQADQTRSRA